MVSFDTKLSPLHIIPHPICPVSTLLINAQGWDSAFTFIFQERKIGRKGGRKKRGVCTDHSACSDDCRTLAQPFLLLDASPISWLMVI